MKATVFEEQLIRTLETRSGGTLMGKPDLIPVNNRAEVRILKLQMEGGILMPIVYSEDYELRYNQGEKLETLADEILEQVRRTRERMPVPENFFRKYEAVRGGIYCKVISADKNRALLEQVPHERHEDLAVVYFYELQEKWMEDASILIRNEHLELWGISVCQVKQDAWENTLEKKQVKFCKLSRVLAEFGLEETEEMEENPLYLLTNVQGTFGAGTAFYPGVLASCAEQMGSDLILLPSSIHEWLLLSADCRRTEADGEELRSMVREINRTQVAEKEVLSDEIYYYSRKSDRLTRI
ncbi:MAG: DUF5688 family protein [Lachnospiraceae bacterium]|nr:DUF5688 family protein [Lachnospiraceae bacterium]